MLVLKSGLLNKFPQIVFGFSTKIGLRRKPPYFFNMSLSVSDSRNRVFHNRRIFFKYLGLDETNVVTQKQVHGDSVTVVDEGGNCGESDAVITDKLNLGLAISSADCPAIFLYDFQTKVIAAIHSGWRSSEKKILLKVLVKLEAEFNCSPKSMIAYIAPSINQKNYEVGEEVAKLFNDKYVLKRNFKYFLDLKALNFDILLDFGLLKKNIQISELCSYEMKELLHSYRRDGAKSGRALGIIAMRDYK